MRQSFLPADPEEKMKGPLPAKNGAVRRRFLYHSWILIIFPSSSTS